VLLQDYKPSALVQWSVSFWVRCYWQISANALCHVFNNGSNLLAYVYRASGNMIYYNGTTYTYAQFANFLADAAPPGAHNINGDPKFYDSYYHVNDDSPAVAAGIVLAGVTSDLEGVSIPFYGTPSMGCYEPTTMARMMAMQGGGMFAGY
jgi:hypothetical protein